MKQLLRSPLFLLGLFLLLLNDFVLKEAFGNVLTGKLSDFAGMFIFPLFWLALFPKYKRLIFVTCGLFFVWWKSPMSQAAIDVWNGLGVFQMGRVVDYSDLWALLMLPLAWWYAESEWTPRFAVLLQKVPPVLPLALACFAFIATSKVTPRFTYEPPKSYTFDFAKDSLEQKIYKLKEISISFNDKPGILYWDADSMMRVITVYTDSVEETRVVPFEEAIRDSMYFEVRSDFSLWTEVTIGGDSLSAFLDLHTIEVMNSTEEDESIYLGTFEDVVIDALRK